MVISVPLWCTFTLSTHCLHYASICEALIETNQLQREYIGFTIDQLHEETSQKYGNALQKINPFKQSRNLFILKGLVGTTKTIFEDLLFRSQMKIVTLAENYDSWGSVVPLPHLRKLNLEIELISPLASFVIF